MRKDLKKLFALHINHPYQETLKMRFLSDEKDRLEEAEKLYKEVLEINPDDYNSSIGVADCCLYMDKLEEAKELYIALIRRNAYDNYVRNQIMNVNEKLIEYYKQEDKHDTISIFKRAWCLFENFRYQEIIDLTEGMTVEEENENQYCDLLGKTYAGLKQYEKSIEYFKQWSDKLEKETDENEDRDYNLNYLYSEIGNQYKKLERYDEALEYYDKALAINEDDVDVLNSKGNVLLLTGRYEESLNILERGLEIDGNFYSLYINKCKVLLELGYDGDALDDAIRAQNIYPYNPECYLLQMKLYNRHGESDNALQVYETAKSYNAVSDKVNLYKIIALQGKKQFEEAKESSIELLKKIKKDGDLDDILGEVYYQLSLIYSDMDNNDQALKYVQEAIKIARETKYYYARAYYYKYKKDFENALSDYDYCISQFPEDTFAYVREAEIYKDLNDPEKSLALYKKVLEIDDHHKFANYEIAEIYNRKGDKITAITYYTRQLEITKEAYYYICRGIAYDSLMRYDEALNDYHEAIKLEPENPHAYNNIGIVYKERKDYETAVKYFKKAIDNMGNEPYKVFFNNIARCYRRLKKYEEAIKYYDKELEIFGGDFDLYDKKAGVYVLMDKYQDAIDIYLECLDVEGIDPVDVYDNIGDIYKDDIKDYNEAIKWYKMAIKLEPEHRYEYRKIGIAYYKKKKYKTAIKFYKKQLEFDEHAYTYVKMGEAYKELHNAVKAKENYQKALDLYKNIKYPDASHYTEMAKCSKELGNIEGAVDYCKKCMYNMCSDCDSAECNEAYYILGEIAELEKDYQKALDYYNKVLEIVDSDDDTEEAIARVKKILG